MLDIQEMNSRGADYFRYFPLPVEARTWGLAVTGAGRTRVAPRAPYPPRGHPDGHHFEWSRGRVLESLQVVLIAAGGGVLETALTKPQPIGAGCAFMLFPRVWHRFRPDSEGGWDESWVELSGPLVNRLLQAGEFEPRAPVLRQALGTGMEPLMNDVHELARRAPAGFSPALAARGLEVLATWHAGLRSAGRESRMGQAVAALERHLVEHLAEPVNIGALARRLGVAYPHLRSAFKAHTGSAPWQYMIRLRLAQARRLLASTDATLAEVASLVGFSSSFHLSASFKKEVGLSPNLWRRRLGVASNREDPVVAARLRPRRAPP